MCSVASSCVLSICLIYVKVSPFQGLCIKVLNRVTFFLCDPYLKNVKVSPFQCLHKKQVSSTSVAKLSSVPTPTHCPTQIVKLCLFIPRKLCVNHIHLSEEFFLPTFECLRFVQIYGPFVWIPIPSSSSYRQSPHRAGRQRLRLFLRPCAHHNRCSSPRPRRTAAAPPAPARAATWPAAAPCYPCTHCRSPRPPSPETKMKGWIYFKNIDLDFGNC